MTWFKVDDTLCLHPKVITAGNAAMGLWVRAGSWASQQLTDGFVPKAIVATLGNTSQARALVTAGLWAEEDGGYRFHDWAQANPTRSEKAAEREATRRRQAEWRARRRTSNGVTDGTRNGVTNSARGDAAPSRPDPTRPEDLGLRERGSRSSVPHLAPLDDLEAWPT